MTDLKQDDQLEHIYSDCVRIRDVAKRPARGDERKVAREGQRYPCWWHDMMIMMMIYLQEERMVTRT